MSDDNRDTSELPPPPKRPKSGEWPSMTDRELMYAILRGQEAAAADQAETFKRLKVIEERQSKEDGTLDILVGVLRQLCLDRGRPDMAQRIDKDILSQRKNGSSNGADEDTNPGH